MTKLKSSIIFTMVVLILVVSGCDNNNQKDLANEKDLTMYIATDIHYLADNLNDHGKAFDKYISNSDGKQLKYINDIVDAFAADISKKKPDILIISGDLTNNGEKESHMELAEKLESIEQNVGTRIFVIPGNHDISNPWARGFIGDEQYVTDSINAEDFASIYKTFGYDEAVLSDETSLSYLAELSDKLWLLMLDTCIYDFNGLTGSPMPNGEITEETMDWIKRCSKAAKKENATIITVMHHNIIDHSERLNVGFTLDNSEDAVNEFLENDLKFVFSGHIHIQDIKSLEDNSLYDITTSALSVYPIQYGVLQYKPVQGLSYSTSQVDVESWAKENDIKDENLINFNDYSERYFASISYGKVFNALTEEGKYSEQEVKLMSETVSLLNRNYFAGTSALIKEEIVQSPGYQLWLDAEDGAFFKGYVISMVSMKDNDNNQLQLQIPR